MRSALWGPSHSGSSHRTGGSLTSAVAGAPSRVGTHSHAARGNGYVATFSFLKPQRATSRVSS
jgi:hypothetical protein